MPKVNKRSNVDADLASNKSRKLRSLRRSDQPTHPEDIPDSEEDPGHSASLQFLAAAKETTKGSNAVIAGHIKHVEEQALSLHNGFDDKALQIKTRDAQQQASFITLLAESRQGIPEHGAGLPKEPVGEKSAGRAIHQSGVSAIFSSRELLAQYGSICEQITLGVGATKKGAGWDDEREALQSLLQRQGEKAKRELYYLLHIESKESEELPIDGASAADDDLWNRYAMQTKMEEERAGGNIGHGWGMVMKRAQRAVHRMVQDLPKESER